MELQVSVPRLSKTLIEKQKGHTKRLYEKGSGLILSYYKSEQRGCIGKFHLITRGIWHPIGKYPAISLRDAQAIAKKINLRREKLAELTANQAQHESGSINNVLDLYLSSLELYEIESSDAKIRNSRAAISKHLKPRLGHLAAEELTTKLVNDLLYNAMKQANYSAAYIKLVIRVLSAALNHSKKLGLIKLNADKLKIRAFTSARVAPKQMQIETYEIKQTIKAIKAKKCIKTRMMCVLMLLHATRLEETTTLTWPAFDFDDRLFVIRASDTKTNARLALPMTETCEQIAKQYKRLRRKTNNRGLYLFPAARNHRKPITKTYACRLVSANNKFSAHDFRKLAKSWMTQKNHVDHFVSELILNHKKSEIDMAYIQGAMYETVKDALNKWHEKLVQCGILECLEC